MPQIKKVKSIEEAGQTTKGTYWKVTWGDDKTSTIFDEEQRILLAGAKELGKQVQVEYIQSGKYWNVKSITLVDDNKPEASPNPQSPPQVQPTHETDGTKNRAICLSYANNWAIALLNSSNFTKKETLNARSIILVADEFAKYVDTGVIPDAPIIKEAKKLDTKAKEV